MLRYLMALVLAICGLSGCDEVASTSEPPIGPSPDVTVLFEPAALVVPQGGIADVVVTIRDDRDDVTGFDLSEIPDGVTLLGLDGIYDCLGSGYCPYHGSDTVSVVVDSVAPPATDTISLTVTWCCVPGYGFESDSTGELELTIAPDPGP